MDSQVKDDVCDSPMNLKLPMQCLSVSERCVPCLLLAVGCCSRQLVNTQEDVFKANEVFSFIFDLFTPQLKLNDNELRFVSLEIPQ
jgi:hypothetical protein